jgi:hypothetical protein
MSTVLGSLAPDLTRGLREREEVAPVSSPSVAEPAHNVALPNGCGPVYNEEAFRYFLQVERKRAGRSRGRFLLLLVDLKRDAQRRAHFDVAASAKLFVAMWPCLRETDFIGWYRQGRVASAVLTQVSADSGTEVSQLVVDRVRKALETTLPSDLVRRLQVRIYQMPAVPTGRT